MISANYADKILTAIAGVSDNISRPANVYLGICITEPNAITGAVSDEPSANSYERKKVGGSSLSTQCFGSASGGIIKNSIEIQMKTARESWGKNYYWFLSDSESGAANIWGELKDRDGVHGVTITAETVPTFYENTLQASIDVPITE